MTKQDAIIAMQNGKKVTHQYFTEDEYIYIDEKTGNIRSEDGVDHADTFWKSRGDIEWQTDWEIFTH